MQLVAQRLDRLHAGAVISTGMLTRTKRVQVASGNSARAGFRRRSMILWELEGN